MIANEEISFGMESCRREEMRGLKFRGYVNGIHFILVSNLFEAEELSKFEKISKTLLKLERFRCNRSFLLL